MATVTICSDFGNQENKVCHCFHYLPFYLLWSGMTRSYNISFLECWSIFLLVIWIPTCASCSLAFHMMYSAYKLNKQGDNIQSWHTPFPVWNQSILPCPVLTVASWPACWFLRRQVRWSGIPVSSRIFYSFLWSTQSKALA